jgi:hypothetical protein
MSAKYIHTSFGVRLGDHYKTFQWLPLTCNVPIEVSLEVLPTTKPPRAPSCAIRVLAITASPTHLQLDGLSYNSILATDWYAKTSLYHILSQAVPIQDLGMITIQGLPATTRHNPKLPATTRHSSQTGHPES